MTGKAGWRVVQDSNISKRFYFIFAHLLTREPHSGVLDDRKQQWDPKKSWWL